MILSPVESEDLLEQKYSKSKMANYRSKAQEIMQKSSLHNKQSLKGNYNVVYKFNENVLQGEADLTIERGKIKLKSFKNAINLKRRNGKKLARSQKEVKKFVEEEVYPAEPALQKETKNQK